VTVPREQGWTPREWIGDDPFPWPPSLGLADGEPLAACFSVAHIGVGRTRSDAAFLKLALTDSHGTLEARMWDDVDAVVDHLRTGSYVGVRGCMETYQDQRQLRIESLALLRVELDDLVLFLPRSARSPDRMDAELAAAIASIGDAALHRLLRALLDPETDTGRAFRLAPAAKQNHHAYLGGLIEHTLSVTRVCDLLAAHYGPALDRDLLVAAALLHDIGKIREIGARSGFPYTDEGKLLGHIIIGMQIVADTARGVPELPEGRLLLLQHLIASHQGRYEWHSPREPRTLEAILLHYADDLDAKLTQAASLIDTVAGGWTAYDRGFGRDFLRHLHAQARPVADPLSAGADEAVQRGAVPDDAAGTAVSAEASPTQPAEGDSGADPPPPRNGAAERRAPESPPDRTPPPPSGPPAEDGLKTLDLFE
jgi:3'-5' exoribonuclease